MRTRNGFVLQDYELVTTELGCDNGCAVTERKPVPGPWQWRACLGTGYDPCAAIECGFPKGRVDRDTAIADVLGRASCTATDALR